MWDESDVQNVVPSLAGIAFLISSASGASAQSLDANVVGVAALGVGYAIAAQPHIEAALSALDTAKHELEVAIQDKAGHVNAAIAEVCAGIQAGK